MEKFYRLMQITEKRKILIRDMVNYLACGKSSDDWSFKNMVDRAKNLVKQEQIILNSLGKNGLDNYCTMIDIFYQGDSVANMLKVKLVTSIFASDATNTLDAKSLGIDNSQLHNQHFVIPDVINAIPKLIALRKLSATIDTFAKNRGRNAAIDKLVVGLRENLKVGNIALLDTSPFLETIFLTSYGKIPDFDLIEIGNALKCNYQEKARYDTVLTNMSITVLKDLKPFISKDFTFKVDYSSEAIYCFFHIIYQLEALVPYIPEDLLHELDILFNQPVTIGKFEFQPTSTSKAIKRALKK